MQSITPRTNQQPSDGMYERIVMEKQLQPILEMVSLNSSWTLLCSAVVVLLILLNIVYHTRCQSVSRFTRYHDLIGACYPPKLHLSRAEVFQLQSVYCSRQRLLYFIHYFCSLNHQFYYLLLLQRKVLVSEKVCTPYQGYGWGEFDFKRSHQLFAGRMDHSIFYFPSQFVIKFKLSDYNGFLKAQGYQMS